MQHCGDLNTRTILAIFLIAASIAVTTTSIATQASAGKPDDPGLETADDNVHKNQPTGDPVNQDKVFHEGTCQGGHTTEALGTCDNPIITDPGNSDNHRQDK